MAQTFEISYYPSFHHNMKYKIICDSIYCQIHYEVFSYNDTSTVIWFERNLVTKEVTNSFFEFLDGIEEFEDDSFGFDGIIINGKYNNNSFKFWSPPKGSSEYKLFKESFAIMKKTLKIYDSKKYYRKLRLYFK